jgi:hypothetical protein
MRARIVLGLALLLAAGALALDMSGRAPRMAGTDHVSSAAFAATVPRGGKLCQPSMTLPYDAQRVEVLIGTYGTPVPALAASFIGENGRTAATGLLPEGAHEGYVRIPLRYPHGPTVNGALCIGVGLGARAPAHRAGGGGGHATTGSAHGGHSSAPGSSRAAAHSTASVVLGGEVFTPSPLTERVGGRPQAGRIDVVYLRPGRESWWQLLGALDERIGLGKASFFGDWTLPVLALALLGAWIAAVRLLAKELT